MGNREDYLKTDAQQSRRLELETQPQEEAASLPFLDDSLRRKATYIFFRDGSACGLVAHL